LYTDIYVNSPSAVAAAAAAPKTESINQIKAQLKQLRAQQSAIPRPTGTDPKRSLAAPAPAPSASAAALAKSSSAAAAPAPSPAPAPSASAANPAKSAAPPAPANAAANSGEPGAPASGVVSGNLTAGDPTTNIDKTINQMRCTVCQSQGIISTALGTTPRPCNNCGATNLNAVAAAATAARERANAAQRAAELALATPSMIPQNKQNKIANAQKRAAIAKAIAAGLPLKLSPNNVKAAKEAANARKAEQAGHASSASPLPTINTTVNNPSFLPPPPAAPTGGRRSRRRHHKTSRRTKNKRYTRRR
jgi:hypothetical protein